MLRLLAVALVAAVSGLACEGAMNDLPGGDDELPTRLVDTGIEVDATTGEVIDPRFLRFSPDWPLWSSGSEKARWIHVPDGEQIDTSEETWEFPVGTILIKTFAYDGQPVETRVVRRGAAEWNFDVYRWEGEEATLLPLDSAVEVEVPLGIHTIPSRADCRGCHLASDSPALGFRDIQLSPASGDSDLGPLATLFTMAPRGEQIVDENPTVEGVLGYVQGNCVSCHNGLGRGSFDLSPGVFLSQTVGVMTVSRESPEGFRIVAGDPEASVLFQLLSQDEGLLPMPPIGIDRVDTGAIELFREFITSLE